MVVKLERENEGETGGAVEAPHYPKEKEEVTCVCNMVYMYVHVCVCVEVPLYPRRRKR